MALYLYSMSDFHYEQNKQNIKRITVAPSHDFYIRRSRAFGLNECMYACSAVISPLLTRSASERFMSIMPTSDPVSMTIGTSWVRRSLIRFATALLLIRSSYAGIRPPDIFGINR